MVISFGISEFEVFVLEVGSCAFPTSFCRMMCFVTSASGAFRMFLEDRSSLRLCSPLSFQFSTIIFGMAWFFALVASSPGSIPEERRSLANRTAVGAVDNRWDHLCWAAGPKCNVFSSITAKLRNVCM